MELNRKLTHLLKGRAIQSESGDEDHVAITFDDESTLKLRVVAGQATVSVGAKVEAVHEGDREIRSGSIGTGLATRYDFSKHFEHLAASEFPIRAIPHSSLPPLLAGAV